MSSGWCPEKKLFFCSGCAIASEEIEEAFWCWDYHYRYRSPWTRQWQVSLDRLEYEGLHPLQRFAGASAPPGVSGEMSLTRYPTKETSWRCDDVPDEGIRESWNRNADRWDAGYDDDGDRNRRFQSDEPLLKLLGEVRGNHVLDAGCGQGYLCRKLARDGAKMVGIELSDRFLEIARAREKTSPLGIVYHHGNVAEMPFLADASFDKVVSNYVLMDVRDYTAAVREVARVLKPGGVFVASFSHPCFACGPGGWEMPAPDSPRPEENRAFRVDHYFHRGPYSSVWGKFDPVISFHRPLRDYWETFKNAGFTVDSFEEPSISERGRREMPLSQRMKAMRIPYSCIFRLIK